MTYRLIDVYWQIGEHISRRITTDGWGQGTVQTLAEYIQKRQPNARGFSSQNLWRMRQFFETYRNQSKLSTLLRELPWSHNLSIMSRCKRDEEREFYLRLAIRERWSFRELQRQLAGALFERTRSSSKPNCTSSTLSPSRCRRRQPSRATCPTRPPLFRSNTQTSEARNERSRKVGFIKVTSRPNACLK